MKKISILLILGLAASGAMVLAANVPAISKTSEKAAVKDTFDLDKELAKPKFQFGLDGRRDPFTLPLTVDPRLVENKIKPVKNDTGNKPSLAAESSRLAEARKKLEAAQNCYNDGKFETTSSLLGEAESILAVKPVNPELAEEYNGLTRQSQALAEKTKDFREELMIGKLQAGLDEAKRLFNARQYDEAAKVSKSVVDAPPKFNSDRIKELVAGYVDIQRRSMLRQEFAKNSLHISGTAHGARGEATVINGYLTKVGGPIPADGVRKSEKGSPGQATPQFIPDATVARIGPYNVVVDYKGELIELPLHD